MQGCECSWVVTTKTAPCPKRQPRVAQALVADVVGASAMSTVRTASNTGGQLGIQVLGATGTQRASIEPRHVLRQQQILQGLGIDRRLRSDAPGRSVALDWLLQRPTLANVIVGARDEEQLRQNLGGVGWTLTPAQVTRLDAASQRPLP